MRDKYSNIVILLIVFVAGYFIFWYPQYVFAYDNFGFYFFLPNLFIYKNFGHIDLSLLNQINEQYNLSYTLYQFSKVESGNIVDRFPIGMAILVAPFFFTGHLMALLSNYPADGFSQPYQWSILASGLFYLAIGFYFTKKVLKFFFSDKTTAVILFVFFFGTNIFFFSAMGNHFPHVYLFTLYALLLYFTIAWHKTTKRKYAVWLGIVFGLILSSRNSEIIAVFIPLFWGVYDRRSLFAKINLLKKEYRQILLLIAFTFLALLPQLVYWWSATGSPVFYAYDDAGSGLNLLKPRFFWVLFSYRKGWLLYSPLMVLSVLGFYFLWKKQKEIFFPIIVYFLINLYLIASFSSLISYGFRAFVHSYAVLIIPFGFSVSFLTHQKKWFVYLLGLLIPLIFFINIFQAWQLGTGILNGRRMTKEYYWSVFLKNKVESEDKKLLLIERYYDGKDRLSNEEEFNKRVLYYNSFENPSNEFLKQYGSLRSSSGNYSYYLDENTEYIAGYEQKMSSITKNYYAWFRISLKVYPLDNPHESNIKVVVGITHKGDIYKYRTVDISDYPDYDEPNRWYTLSIDYLTPELRSSSDYLNVYIWNQGKNKAYLDEFKVEALTVD
ncbi:MAG: hypothetical protein K9G76_00050 [Bacteroidales bacterium]|nr:hypothetical protein [Bacteroidales bacterium]MCF8402502.1 hypothetical protein [Bacteroidales bacterium]